MLDFVSDSEANLQINTIYDYVKRKYKSEAIVVELERRGIQHINSSDGRWSEKDIVDICQKFRLDTDSPRLMLQNNSQTSVLSGISEVVITDIKMPFSSMIVFMIKWALASIPALIILIVIGAILAGIFAGGLGALIR